MSVRLSSYPHVCVAIVCEGCSRRGRYRLARLAVRFGAEAEMTAVLDALVVGCKSRTPAAGGCGAKIVDPVDEAARRVPKGVPKAQRNPRRGYDHDGLVIEPATIASILPPAGSGRMVARCQRDGCRHQTELDVTTWPPDLYLPDVGLRLRCGKCFARGPWTVPVHKDKGPGGYLPGLMQ